MGGVGSFEIVNQGIEYSSAPTLNSFRHAVLKDITGTFNSNTSLTSHTGTVTEFDIDRQLISIDTTANLVVGNTVSTTTGSGVIANIDTAIATGQVGTFTETSGNFLDNDGLLSNELQRIQDSFYYQDYSYVVRVGDSINTWRDAIKSTVHPAGWNVFGEVEVVNSVSAKVSVQTLDSYSPEFASALRGVFTTIFGRRLGTVDDGTSIRANSKVGTNELSDLTSTTRDVTLTPKRNIIIGSARTAKRTGPTLDLLAKYAFAVPPIPDNAITVNYPNFRRTARTNHNDGAYFTIEQFADFKIEQVSTDITQNHFDGNTKTFDSGNITFDDGLDTSIPSAAFNTNINVPPPGQINLIQGGGFTSFDETGETFDSGIKKFDIG